MRRRIALVGAALAWPAATAAAPLTVAKTGVVVADGVSALNPRALPGALVDYHLLVANPLGNTLATVAGVTVIDVLPATVKLRVVDLVAGGAGPVEFTDGNLLGLGLLGSGLGYSYAALGSAADGIDFSDNGGATWTYVPGARCGRVRPARARDPRAADGKPDCRQRLSPALPSRDQVTLGKARDTR